jgi:pimeloyl-ACP methyl ester carboxylesterase
MTKKIFFREYGEGRNLVILHGILGCSDLWIPVARKLSEHFHVIVPDLPNHGQSEHSESIDFGPTAESLCNFLKTNNIDKPSVIAHSYGAKVAFQMLAKGFPFEKIVAVDMLPSTTFAEPAITQIIEFVGRPLPCIKSFAEAKKLFTEQGFVPGFADLLAKGMTMKNGSLQWKFNAKAIAENGGQLLQPIHFEGVTEIPLLVVKGQLSPYVDDNAIADAKTHFKNTSVAVVPNAGHWLHFDQPEIFHNIVCNFLTNN